MKLDLITYGCGNKFDRNKFKKIENQATFNKPKGGLWASPIKTNYGWNEYCKQGEFVGFSSSFEFLFKGNILIIDNELDLKNIDWLNDEFDIYKALRGINFKKMLNKNIDAIYLTAKGEEETKFTDPGLYGWDCECVLIMNVDTIKEKVKV